MQIFSFSYICYLHTRFACRGISKGCFNIHQNNVVWVVSHESLSRKQLSLPFPGLSSFSEHVLLPFMLCTFSTSHQKTFTLHFKYHIQEIKRVNDFDKVAQLLKALHKHIIFFKLNWDWRFPTLFLEVTRQVLDIFQDLGK